MKIGLVKNALRIGEIKNGTKAYAGKKYVYYKFALELVYDKHFPKEFKRKHLTLVYIFTVNGVIYKIGQSSGKSGISGCIGFYLIAGQEDPGINRFSINWFIRKELKNKNKVEVYMVYMDLIKAVVPGLNKDVEIMVPISAKGMEEIFMEQYNELTNSYPVWNYQETGKPLPSDIHIAFGKYKVLRGEGRS
jgi:hypothetical protein